MKRFIQMTLMLVVMLTMFSVIDVDYVMAVIHDYGAYSGTTLWTLGGVTLPVQGATVTVSTNNGSWVYETVSSNTQGAYITSFDEYSGYHLVTAEAWYGLTYYCGQVYAETTSVSTTDILLTPGSCPIAVGDK